MSNETIAFGTPGGVQIEIPARQVVEALIKRLQTPPAVHAISNLPKIGEYWPGQGGIYVGIMRADDGSLYHLIKAEADFAKLEYDGYGEEESGVACHWDGLANTRALVASNTAHPAAEAAAEHEADGHRDFYLMSRREGCLIAATVPHLMQKARYWTSTQYSSGYAWAVDFESGRVLFWTKTTEFRVCPVRRLPL